MARLYITPYVLLLMAIGCSGPDEGTPSPAQATPTSPPEPTPTVVPSTPVPTSEPTPVPTPVPTTVPTPEKVILAIKGVVPSAGAMAIPRFPVVEVVFTDDLPEGQESAVLAHLVGPGGTTIGLNRDTGSDEDGDAVVPFLPVAPLQADTEYVVEVEVSEVEGVLPQGGSWPLLTSSDFSTEVPCGVAFNIVTDVQILALGANQALVQVLQGILDTSSLAPVALEFVDVFTPSIFPLSNLRLVSGLPVRGEVAGVWAVDPVYGFPVSVEDCEVDTSGALNCAESTFVFPIPITDDSVLYLTISHAQLSGDVSVSGDVRELDNFLLSGVVTEDDLLDTLAAIGMESIADLVKLDVDLDGDGVLDAASAEAASNPVWLDFEECDETGGAAPQ